MHTKGEFFYEQQFLKSSDLLAMMGGATCQPVFKGRSWWQVPSNKRLSFTFDLGLVLEPAKIAQPTVFQVVLQGIGKSFQSAITAPRLNLTGYGNATAQSWQREVRSESVLIGCAAVMWDATWIKKERV